MDRRAFIGTLAGGLLAAPLAAGAQQAEKTYRIGVLVENLFPQTVAAFEQTLLDLGYDPGRNLSIDYRSTDGRSDQLVPLAATLALRNVDVVVVSGTAAAHAAKAATRTIPIVMASVGDAVAAGLADSLSRPGGNITGLSMLAPEVTAKGIEILKELLPKRTRFAVLWNSRSGRFEEAVLQEIRVAAHRLHVRVQEFDVTTMSDVDAAFASMALNRVEACIVLPNPPNNRNLSLILAKTRNLKLPAIYGLKEVVAGGGLLSYGVDFVDLWRRAAVYVDKILRGASPRDLPIEQARRFELAINLKTAKALGLTIPPSLLQRADQVIE